jgi:hypothetical protein
LEFMQSSPTDIDPDTPTFTFRNATYTSSFITFVPVEEFSRSEAVAQPLTTEQQALSSQYDTCTSTSTNGGIPFIDIANAYVVNCGAQFALPLIAGDTWTSVTSQLNTPSTTVAQDMDGAANTLIAAICKVDGEQPASVCADYASPSSSSTSSSNTSTISQPNLVIGQPTTNSTTLSYLGGTTTFTTYEVFPLTVTSSDDVQVQLSALDLPSGVWVHFAPSTIVATPDGTLASMTLAGAVQPIEPTAGNSTIDIMATGPSGSASASLSVIGVVALSIIHSPSPISFPNPVQVNPNGTSSIPNGAVYDPSTPSSTPLTVSLSVMGVDANGTLLPLPKGLQIVFPNSLNSSITLQPEQPTYFLVGAIGSSVKPGSYEVAIQETIGSFQFTENLEVIVMQITL